VKSSEDYGRMAVRYGGNSMNYRSVYEWVERLKGVLTSVRDARCVWPYGSRVTERSVQFGTQLCGCRSWGNECETEPQRKALNSVSGVGVTEETMLN
jgi:hypothetical protein